MLVGKSVREFVDERELLHVLGRPRGEVQFARLKVVERGGLLGQNVDELLFEVEVIADESEKLEKQFVEADLFGGSFFGDSGLDKLADFVTSDQLAVDGLTEFEARDLAQDGEHAVHLVEQLAGALGGNRRVLGAGGKRADEH